MSTSWDRQILDRVGELTEGLRQFGYEDITQDEVQTECENLVAGQEPTSVVGMFIQSLLRDRLPQLERERDRGSAVLGLALITAILMMVAIVAWAVFASSTHSSESSPVRAEDFG
jgi:hypothetical protein